MGPAMDWVEKEVSSSLLLCDGGATASAAPRGSRTRPSGATDSSRSA